MHGVGRRGHCNNEERPDGAVLSATPAGEARQRRVSGEYDYLLAENVARAIDEDTDTLLNVRASRDILSTVLAALESARTGKPVAVQGD